MTKKLLFFFLVALLTACPIKKTPSNAANNENLTAGNANTGILKVSVAIDEVRGHGTISIRNIPNDAKLSCGLNNKKLDDCEDAATFTLPSEDGEHSITVIARKKSVITAVGEAHFLIGKPSQRKPIDTVIPGSITRAYNSDLSLEIDLEHNIDGQPFHDGMAIKRTQDARILFRFPNEPLCDPVLRCTTDRVTSNFAPICDLPMGKSFLANTMPKGLQYLRVQAACGDKVGEPLIVFWYGVPQDYVYMGLESTYYAHRNDYVFQLMNPGDCPLNLLSFECRQTASGPFSACKGQGGETHVINSPPEGFAIRAVCNGTPYGAFEPRRSH